LHNMLEVGQRIGDIQQRLPLMLEICTCFLRLAIAVCSSSVLLIVQPAQQFDSNALLVVC
jgi:hypothetical protein